MHCRRFYQGSLEVGNRGGFAHDPSKAHVPLLAEDGE